MRRNTWWLPLWLGCTLGAVYLLPQAGETAQSAAKMNLPGNQGRWWFKTIGPSEEEVGTLGSETEFAKAICLKPRKGEYDLDGNIIPDRIDLSVVLSGSDLNSSIHRPERCMSAQGHLITASGNLGIKLPNGRAFDAKRLLSVQTFPGRNGAPTIKFNCVTYYFFVGHDSITNGHWERTFIDIKDRLMRGMDQRWAYISVSTWYGKTPMLDKEISLSEADGKLSDFLTNFVLDQIDWDQVKH